MSGFITRPPPKKSTDKLVQRPNIRPPDVEHPKVMVGYKNVPPQFKPLKRKPNSKRSAPVGVSDVEAEEVLKRIQSIKSRMSKRNVD